MNSTTTFAHLSFWLSIKFIFLNVWSWVLTLHRWKLYYHGDNYLYDWEISIFLCAWASLVAQTVKRLWATWETRVQFLGRKIPRRRKWQSTPALSPGKSHGRRSLVGCSPWGHQESDKTERLHFHFSFLKAPLFSCPQEIWTKTDWSNSNFPRREGVKQLHSRFANSSL